MNQVERRERVVRPPARPKSAVSKTMSSTTATCTCRPTSHQPAKITLELAVTIATPKIAALGS
ncbi:MAG: hypothetical protein IPI35_30325 [Deltaproteobacteria bacterium]|nr:hypothetical protein [Deltaproteobacteria bacterium]